VAVSDGWILDTGFRILAAGCLLLISGYRRLACGFRFLETDFYSIFLGGIHMEIESQSFP
jgi:hypothetical protein